MADLSVTFLGTSASVPTPQRNVAAQLLTFDGKRFLIDCGEGTQRQMMRYGGLKAPEAIFITHYHPDHILGLPGLLSTLATNEHDRPVKIYGPPGVEGLERMCVASGAFSAKNLAEFHVISPDDVVRFGKLTITPYKTAHSAPSQGYVFKEDDRPGHFNIERAAEFSIHPGPEFGALQRGEMVKGVLLEDVVDADRPGRKVVFTGDTRPVQETVIAAQNADLLVHEATFDSIQESRARKVKHSTIDEAISIGQQANAKHIALTHFSPRTHFDYTWGTSDAWSKRITFARDGDVYAVLSA